MLDVLDSLHSVGLLRRAAWHGSSVCPSLPHKALSWKATALAPQPRGEIGKLYIAGSNINTTNQFEAVDVEEHKSGC